MKAMQHTAKQLIEALGLQPLRPEGGWFRQVYRSAATHDGRSLASAIFYLLTPDCFSHLHRLDADEVYHFYQGDPVEMLVLRADGSTEHCVLGHDVLGGQKPMHAVPAGCWQGACLAAGGSYALLGTTMSPAFDPASYEQGMRTVLLREYPNETDWICRLTDG